MHMGIGLILWIRALVQNTKIDIHALTCTCLHFALYAQEGTQHSLGSRITYHFLSKQTFSLLSTYRRINVGQAVTSFYNVLFLVCLIWSLRQLKGNNTHCARKHRGPFSQGLKCLGSSTSGTPLPVHLLFPRLESYCKYTIN